MTPTTLARLKEEARRAYAQLVEEADYELSEGQGKMTGIFLDTLIDSVAHAVREEAVDIVRAEFIKKCGVNINMDCKYWKTCNDPECECGGTETHADRKFFLKTS